MILRQHVLAAVRDGRVTLAFRRWRRPTVRTGGTLLTAAGQLEIRSVERVALGEISAADARRAGYESREALIEELRERTIGDVYRIELGRLRDDPRIALRQRPTADGDDRDALLARIRRLDARPGGPWVFRVLEMIGRQPGVRAADLCPQVGQDKDDFKADVRKLKALGLTESLEIGYRLSPRGAALLDDRRARPDPATRPRRG